MPHKKTWIMQNRSRTSQTGGIGYRPPRPPTSWVPPVAPHMHQPSYVYMQPGAYPGPAPQYSISQPAFAGYPPPAQQTAQVAGYDYYSQQQQPQPPSVGGSSDDNSYGYSQMPASYNGQNPYGDSTFSQSAVGYPQTYGQTGNYSQAGSQAGFAQPIPQAGYNQQSYTTQEGANPSYGVESSIQQAPPGQQPGATSQPGYANQPSVPANYSQAAPSAPPPQGQQPQPSQAYVQQGPQASQAGYAQPAQAYGQAYSQPPAGYVSGTLPPGYGQPPSYGGAPLYGDAYSGGAYSQPPYSADATATTSAEAAAASGATKASHSG